MSPTQSHGPPWEKSHSPTTFLKVGLVGLPPNRPVRGLLKEPAMTTITTTKPTAYETERKERRRRRLHRITGDILWTISIALGICWVFYVTLAASLYLQTLT